MFRVAIRLMLLCSAALTIGCGSKCKNPQRTFRPGLGEGPEIQCNMVLLCSKNGGRGDEIVVLPKGQDPTIVDRGSDSWNVSGCKREADDRHIIGSACTIKSISPAEICLDPPPSQTGPDYTGPTGGTLVTVGVGAGSGDHYLNDEDPGGDESEDDDQPTE